MTQILSNQEIRDLLPAYALGALEPDEVQQVEAALRQSAELRAELAEFEQVTDALLQAVPPVEPPSSLGATIMAMATPTEMPPTIPLTPGFQFVRPNRARIISTLAAALLIVALAVFLIVRGSDTTDPMEAQISTILEDDASLVVDIMGAEGHETLEGSFVIASDHHEAVLQLSNIDVLSPEQAYQLWLVRGDERLSGLIFQPDASSTLHLVTLPDDFASFQAIGVTIEPAEGSPGPTSDPVFVTPLEL